MKLAIIKSFLVSLCLVLVAGCATSSVYNVRTKTFEEVASISMKNGILNAGESLGWMMKEENSNTIIGLMKVKEHQAKIAIVYTKDSYSIRLIEALNMNYDSQKQVIRKGYNSWILKLENTIDALVNPLYMTEKLKTKELDAQKDKNLLKNAKEAKKTIDNSFYGIGTSFYNSNLREVYDVINTPILKKLTLKNIEENIFSMGQQQGWLMKKQENGFILAKKIVRHHIATIRIMYTQNNYSITYVTSEKLHYQGYHIHQNYNIWVKELEKGINFSLS